MKQLQAVEEPTAFYCHNEADSHTRRTGSSHIYFLQSVKVRLGCGRKRGKGENIKKQRISHELKISRTPTSPSPRDWSSECRFQNECYSGVELIRERRKPKCFCCRIFKWARVGLWRRTDADFISFLLVFVFLLVRGSAE